MTEKQSIADKVKAEALAKKESEAEKSKDAPVTDKKESEDKAKEEAAAKDEGKGGGPDTGKLEKADDGSASALGAEEKPGSTASEDTKNALAIEAAKNQQAANHAVPGDAEEPKVVEDKKSPEARAHEKNAQTLHEKRSAGEVDADVSNRGIVDVNVHSPDYRKRAEQVGILPGEGMRASNPLSGESLSKYVNQGGTPTGSEKLRALAEAWPDDTPGDKVLFGYGDFIITVDDIRKAFLPEVFDAAEE